MTLGQIWLHASHRVGAVLVTLVLSIVIVKTLRIARGVRSLTVPALCLIPLLVIQISLGVLTVLYYKPADLASLHVACGALVLLTSFILAACAVKGFGIRTNEVHEVISIDAPIGPFLRYAGGGIGRGASEV